MFIVFPGQGSQKSGMGLKFAGHPIFESFIKSSSQILNRDLAFLLNECSNEELSKTENAQVAIFLMNHIIMQIAKESKNIQPTKLAGHSLGEFNALVEAGVFSFEDALRFVAERGKIMSEMKSGAMMALMGCDLSQALSVCAVVSQESSMCFVGNYNSSGQIILSGCKEALKRASDFAKVIGKKSIMLNVSGAFHSPYMHEASLRLKDLIEKFELKEPKIDVISNLFAKPVENAQDWKQFIPLHVKSMVRWKEIMDYANQEEILEIGACEVLTKISKRDGANIKFLEVL